jgi:acyl-ACP thioesterase
VLKNYFDKSFEPGFFEMNKFGEATPLTMLTLLEETAAEHCLAIKHGLYDLIKQDIGWVLLSGIMKMERYPRYKEKITVKTWLSGYSAARGIRENLVLDEQERVIGRAKGLWLFYNIKNKRPVRIFEEIKNRWSLLNEESIKHNIAEKIDAIDEFICAKEFNVRHFDMDMNQHVNNIRYLQWVLEAIPETVADNYFLHSIDGRFLAEARYGDRIMSLTNNNERDHSFSHTIKTKENKICATGRTLWKQRA